MQEWERQVADETLSRISNYRKKKDNTIFDDFYRSHLDFMEKCIDFYIDSHKDPSANSNQV